MQAVEYDFKNNLGEYGNIAWFCEPKKEKPIIRSILISVRISRNIGYYFLGLFVKRYRKTSEPVRLGNYINVSDYITCGRHFFLN